MADKSGRMPWFLRYYMLPVYGTATYFVGEYAIKSIKESNVYASMIFGGFTLGTASGSVVSALDGLERLVNGTIKLYHRIRGKPNT